MEIPLQVRKKGALGGIFWLGLMCFSLVSDISEMVESSGKKLGKYYMFHVSVCAQIGA